MAVDRLRSCYKTHMRFFRDSDQLTEVEWYFVPEGTPYLPFAHKFLSTAWCSDPGPADGLGEVPYDMRWSNGAGMPAGQTFRPCGPVDWWQNGVPSTTQNVPVDSAGRIACCVAPIPPGGVPAGPGLWLSVADLTGPTFSSVVNWPNRANAANPALSVGSGHDPWIAPVTVQLARAVRFAGPQLLKLVSTVGAGAHWTCYGVLWLPSLGNRFGAPLSNDAAFPNRNTILSGQLGVFPANFVIDQGGLILGVGTEPKTKRFIVRYVRDGGTITVAVWSVGNFDNFSSGFTGSWPLLYVGGDPFWGVQAASTDLAEVILYERVLSTTEDVAIRSYLESTYPL